MPYPEDAAFRAAVLELLGAVWPRVPAAIALARSWGADWFTASTPFTRFVAGRAAGHVGVVPVHLAAAGRDLIVAGVHAVCTHPAARGQGHYRAAMEEALAFIDARFPTAILWTDEPGIYRRFGFTQREEHVFRGSIPERLRGQRAGRLLRTDGGRDLGVLSSMLRTRTPVSGELAAHDPGWHFLIDLALWMSASPGSQLLHHLEDLGCIAVAETRGDTFHLYDLVATEVPPLEAVLARLAGDAQAVEVHFAPDRIGGELAPRPCPPPEALMIRGEPLPAEGPLALSPFIHT